MARFLFVVPPLTGHVNPTLGVGKELADRGHEVAWTGYAGWLRPVLPADATLIPVGPDTTVHRWERSQDLRGASALKFLWDDFLIPLAHEMAPGVESAVDEFGADVIIGDQQTLSGGLVARRRGMPWATSATTTSELNNPYGMIPKVARWIEDSIVTVQREYGLTEEQIALGDLRYSEHLVLFYSTPALVGPSETLPAHFAFVGPSVVERPGDGDFPWDWLDPQRRHVLVSLGTLNSVVGERFFRTVVEGLTPLGDQLQVIIAAAPDLVGEVPDHFLVRPHVPQVKLLPYLDAVVSHGGHNTVVETLAHGVPLVTAPIRDDQPIVAQQVVDAGAGLRLRFARVKPEQMHDAVLSVLTEPSFKQAAERIRVSFDAAGGPATAANLLEKLI